MEVIQISVVKYATTHSSPQMLTAIYAVSLCEIIEILLYLSWEMEAIIHLIDCFQYILRYLTIFSILSPPSIIQNHYYFLYSI